MRKRISIVALAGAFAALRLICSRADAQVKPPVTEAPATRPSVGPTDVPVKEVVLFSSGVGYFEHFGSVKGDATAELRFKTDQINDVLKSLLLQDMDGGKIGAVSYSGQSPLEHTLKSFQIDIAANPNMADLLNQLRGAKLSVVLDGGDKLSGAVLGVEKKMKTVAGRETNAEEEYQLNLKVGRQFRSVPLDRVQSMELDDPKLQSELDAALEALVHAGDQDKTPMTLHFGGLGERRVRFGYVVETPVWKTSYRLVLGDAGGQANNQANPGALPVSSKLQGWAIIDNQTDNDWTDVELTLVSGRPLSFIQDLYHSLYVRRPVVQPESTASLEPQTYSGGISKDDAEKMQEVAAAANANIQERAGQFAASGGGGAGGQALFEGGGGKEKLGPMNPTSSVVSAASAAQVGDLFQYAIGNISLGRQKSAMIPIINDDIEAERISIYNASVLSRYPLLGARLKNTTKKHLLQGPITVLDHGSYAGDARIEDVPPGQERLISYGIDQKVLIDDDGGNEMQFVTDASIVKGILLLQSKHIRREKYVADNKSDDTRTLIVEHPRQAYYELTEPKEADETTDIVFRFRRQLPPHKAVKLSVVTELRSSESIGLFAATPAQLQIWLQDNAIPQKVRDAFARVLQMNSDVAGILSQIDAQKGKIAAVAEEQSRIRENLKSVPADSDYYKRLIKKLDEQETGIETNQKMIVVLQEKLDAAEKQLKDYVQGLNIDAAK